MISQFKKLLRRMARSSLAKNSVFFALPMIAFALLGIASIPVLISALGASGWSDIVAAQALGGIGAIVIGFGWGATGPIAAARADAKQRPQLYITSIISRAYIAAVALPTSMGLTALLVNPHAATLIAALGASIPGLSATWYFIGTGRPLSLLLADTAPRILGTVAGLILTYVSGDATPYVLFTALGAVMSVVLGATIVLKGSQVRPARTDFTAATLARTLRSQSSGAITVVASSSYANLPIVLVQALAPTSAPMFNMSFRIMRYGATALLPLMQSLQAWTPRDGFGYGRLRDALLIALGVSAGAGVLAGLLAPLAASVLSGGQLPISPTSAAAIGICIFAIGASQHVGLTGLVLLDRRRVTAISTVAGAALGVPLVALAASAFGGDGAMVATAVAELVVLAWQLASYVPLLRSIRESERHADG